MQDDIERPDRQYWDRVYSAAGGSPNLPLPSQFATFVAQEAQSCDEIIEIGCGTGRDALFFAQHGFRVSGFDGSDAAIQGCQELAERFHVLAARFFVADAASATFHETLIQRLVDPSRGSICIYARFFLHAIDKDTESGLFNATFPYLRPNDLVALEFRTPRDRSLEKATPSHYRRYVEPSDVMAKATAHSLVIRYAVEGFGFAKYKHDDAYVSRIVLGL